MLIALAGMGGIHVSLSAYELCSWHKLSINFHSLLLNIEEGIAEREVVDPAHARICGKLRVNIEEHWHVYFLSCTAPKSSASCAVAELQLTYPIRQVVHLYTFLEFQVGCPWQACTVHSCMAQKGPECMSFADGEL